MLPCSPGAVFGRARLVPYRKKRRKIDSPRTACRLAKPPQTHAMPVASKLPVCPAERGKRRAQSPVRAHSGSSGSAQAADRNLQGLISWCMANGVSGIGTPDSKLGLFESKDEGCGMLFLQDAKEEEILISIPLRLAIADHPEDQASNAALGRESPSYLRLAVKLLQQKRDGEASPWFPFIQALPRQVPSPFGTWPEAALQDLQLPNVPKDLEHAFRHSLGGLPELGISSQELRWAVSIVHSRSFQTAGKGGGLGVRMLLPLADMFNHAGDAADFLLQGPSTQLDNVRWELQPAEKEGRWNFLIRACRDVESGEEACFAYCDLPSWHFFLYCGFVPQRNGHEAVALFCNAKEAVQWYFDRFPPPKSRLGVEEGSLTADHWWAFEAALRAAAPSELALSGGSRLDVTALLDSNKLQLSAKGVIDSRLMAAFSLLVKYDSGVPIYLWDMRFSGQYYDPSTELLPEEGFVISTGRSRVNPTAFFPELMADFVWSRAQRLVGLRIAELLFAPQVTSLLEDLQLLIGLEEDEDEKSYLSALLEYYSKVIEDFEENYGGVIALASCSSSGPSPGVNEQTDPAVKEDLEAARLLALQLRVAQKQVMWETMPAIFRDSVEYELKNPGI